MPPRPAVFLDRDGTLNVEVNYLHRVEDFAWIPGAVEAVGRLNRAGLPVVVITNQAAVAHGYCDEADVLRIHRHMAGELRAAGAWIDAFYYCTSHPRARVEALRRDDPRRKPGTGMFEEALRDWNADPAGSWMVGDRGTDLEPAARLGMRTILVETGYGAAEKAHVRADHVAPDLPAAVDLILRARSSA
jgi:D-glycero-D-manno-heptose 1,7-bisphosphate phosphatase